MLKKYLVENGASECVCWLSPKEVEVLLDNVHEVTITDVEKLDEEGKGYSHTSHNNVLPHGTEIDVELRMKIVAEVETYDEIFDTFSIAPEFVLEDGATSASDIKGWYGELLAQQSTKLRYLEGKLSDVEDTAKLAYREMEDLELLDERRQLLSSLDRNNLATLWAILREFHVIASLEDGEHPLWDQWVETAKKLQLISKDEHGNYEFSEE